MHFLVAKDYPEQIKKIIDLTIDWDAEKPVVEII